jgi:hypothetical protein
MKDTFGWAAINGGGSLMLPVFPTRVEAIHYTMAVMDGPYPPERAPKGLSTAKAARWRQMKTQYGVAVIRVRVTPAFQEPTT